MLIYNNCIKYGAEKLHFENTAKPHSNTKIYRRENFSLILGRNTNENLGMLSAWKTISYRKYAKTLFGQGLAIKPNNFLKAIIFMIITLESASIFLSAGEIDQMSSSFNKNAWNSSDWIFVKRRDMAGRSEWLQKDDCIENDGNHTAMVYKKKFKGDMTATAATAFADRMAPAIVIVSKLGEAADGGKVFDEHIEIVIYDEGVNIWRLHTVDGKSLWEKTAFWKFKLTKNNMYKLEVTKTGKALSVKVDGQTMGYVDSSLQEEYYVGITGCEGVNRFYNFTVKNINKLK